MRQSLNNIILFSMPVVTLLLLAGCHSSKQQEATHVSATEAITIIPDAAIETSGAFFTHDNQSRPVICWTEKVSEDAGYVVRFARFDTLTQLFDEPVTVTSSKGTRAHDESMNKIAFKADGTIVAIFAVKHPTEENRFAGSILYSMSDDDGKTWTSPEYLHSDTAKTYGRSFFDVARLPDGEVAAVWLDGRFGRESTGSALFFAKTRKGKGFGKDWQIGESTCECCRTDIYLDAANNIHVAYRDILFPPELMGQQVRDMVHSVSTDGGKTFTPARRISEDNWAIEGCPHTGPSLTANDHGLHALWFTAGGDPGVYYAISTDNGSTFSPREKVSSTARFPQMITLKNGTLAMVWSESKAELKQHQHAGAHVMHADNSSSSGSQIMLQMRGADGSVKDIVVATSEGDASHPVVTEIGKEMVLVAWTEREDSRSVVYYRVVEV